MEQPPFPRITHLSGTTFTPPAPKYWNNHQTPSFTRLSPTSHPPFKTAEMFILEINDERLAETGPLWPKSKPLPDAWHCRCWSERWKRVPEKRLTRCLWFWETVLLSLGVAPWTWPLCPPPRPHPSWSRSWQNHAGQPWSKDTESEAHNSWWCMQENDRSIKSEVCLFHSIHNELVTTGTWLSLICQSDIWGH